MKSRAEDLVPLSKRISAAELHLKIAFLFRQISSDDGRLSPFSWQVTHEKMLLNLFVYEYENIASRRDSFNITYETGVCSQEMIVERWRQVRPPIVVARRQTSSSYRDHYRLLVVLLGLEVKQHTIYPSRYLW